MIICRWKVRSAHASFVSGRLIYERLTEVPDVLYGTDLGSNYQAQGLKLSKHFK